jgi:hypothetical protein
MRRFLTTAAVLASLLVARPVLAGDSDGDGNDDRYDNCPMVPNPDQSDYDRDGCGNACDLDPYDPTDCSDAPDRDGDSVVDPYDNCPFVSNPPQEDTDADGCGDACDPAPLDPALTCDDDGDGVANGEDNCPAVPNPGQLDTDGDRCGDACDDAPTDPSVCNVDDDPDGDGVGGAGGPADNCPSVPNPDQRDADSDGCGDACDVGWLDPSMVCGDDDVDDDGVANASDTCPVTADPAQVDTDGDGAGDACEPGVRAVRSLRLHRGDGAMLRARWGDVAGALAYDVLAGDLDGPWLARQYGHDDALACAVATGRDGMDVLDASAPGRARYYLVAAVLPDGLEHGTDSEGTPRPPGAAGCR